MRQLVPVGDLPLYASINEKTSVLAINGLKIFTKFESGVYHLTDLVRQQGAENIEFRQLLERLASGDFTEMDHERLQEQSLATLHPDVQQEFQTIGKLSRKWSFMHIYKLKLMINRANGGGHEARSG